MAPIVGSRCILQSAATKTNLEDLPTRKPQSSAFTVRQSAYLAPTATKASTSANNAVSAPSDATSKDEDDSSRQGCAVF